MTGQVDFYVLPGTSSQQRWKFACRVVEKAYLRGMRVAVLGADAAELTALDELLWTFSDQAFVPHEIDTGEAPADPAPVRLMQALPPGTQADLVVNLGAQLPAEPTRFARIAEILDADPLRRQGGRERFKAYRDLQLTLKTHQIDDAGDSAAAP
jgi:DNA polymerase-3 subunit chi